MATTLGSAPGLAFMPAHLSLVSQVGSRSQMSSVHGGKVAPAVRLVICWQTQIWWMWWLSEKAAAAAPLQRMHPTDLIYLGHVVDEGHSSWICYDGNSAVHEDSAGAAHVGC